MGMGCMTGNNIRLHLRIGYIMVYPKLIQVMVTFRMRELVPNKERNKTIGFCDTLSSNKVISAEDKPH
jgi:hypothetical protein